MLWVAMIIIGTFIRGPGWKWFWPGQTWDHNRLIYEVNRDLPDLFGITSNLGKMIFGAIVVGGYYAGRRLYRCTRCSAATTERLPAHEPAAVLHHACSSCSPWWRCRSKMLLRLLWHIKYVWITPWFNI